MGCLRSTVTALLLCISLVSMVDFLILAHRDLNKNNNETRYQGQASAKRWHRVRRIAAEEVKEEVRSCMKLTTGDAKATVTELLQPSNTEESSAKATKPDWKKEEDEANEVHSYSNTRNKNTKELKLFEASDEIFKMLNRDYDLRPRHHPPVHN